MGIALMYGGLALRPGDEVLTTTHDFYSTEASLARELGVVASATPYQQPYLRLGPSIVTTPEEMDSAVAAVAELV